VSFKKAVRETPNLGNAWLPGLQALRTQDRPHVSAADTRLLKGSVNVDGALQATQPNANRWDFAIGYRHSNRQKDCIYWVEIHTANDKETEVVLRKLVWLRQWLTNEGQPLNAFERDFIWVSSGTTSYTLTAPQTKRFAELGLQQRGRILRIPVAR
jgi:hypothetical protein